MEESIDTRAEVHVKGVADLKNALESTRDEYDTLVVRMNLHAWRQRNTK